MKRGVCIGALLLALSCTGLQVRTRRPASPGDLDALKTLVTTFAKAVDGRDFSGALACLGTPWSERYTVARLEKDFTLEPLAKQRTLALSQAAANTPFVVSGTTATLRLPNGRVATFENQQGRWRLTHLETPDAL